MVEILLRHSGPILSTPHSMTKNSDSKRGNKTNFHFIQARVQAVCLQPVLRLNPFTFGASLHFISDLSLQQKSGLRVPNINPPIHTL